MGDRQPSRRQHRAPVGNPLPSELTSLALLTIGPVALIGLVMWVAGVSAGRITGIVAVPVVGIVLAVAAALVLPVVAGRLNPRRQARLMVWLEARDARRVRREARWSTPRAVLAGHLATAMIFLLLAVALGAFAHPSLDAHASSLQSTPVFLVVELALIAMGLRSVHLAWRLRRD